MHSADTVVNVHQTIRTGSYHPGHAVLASCLLLGVAASNRSLAGRLPKSARYANRHMPSRVTQSLTGAACCLQAFSFSLPMAFGGASV